MNPRSETTPPGSPREHAFTRFELLVVMGVLSLMACCALPLLAGNRQLAGLSACANNLRQLGQGMRLWANDHIGEMPWRTRVAQGGTRPNTGAKPGNAWYEWVVLSNQLATPKILVCPSDSNKRNADNWSSDTNGILNTLNRDNAISYVMGLDAVSEAGFSLVSGDRNMKFDRAGTGCSAGVNNARGVDTWFVGLGEIAWTNAIHGEVGNILFLDGNVLRTSSQTLRDQFRRDQYDNGSAHFLSPK